MLVDASSTNQKYMGLSPSTCAKSLSVRSSISAGLKSNISKLKARTRIASLWLEKSGTRKLNFSSMANQSPLARCIPYMLLIADVVSPEKSGQASTRRRRSDVHLIVSVVAQEN